MLSQTRDTREKPSDVPTFGGFPLSGGGDHRRPAPGLDGAGLSTFSLVAIREGAGTPGPANGEVWPCPCRETARTKGTARRNRPGGRQGVSHPPAGSNLLNGLGGVSTALPWPFTHRPALGRTPGSGRRDVFGCPAPRGSAHAVWSGLPGPTMPRRPSPRRSSSCTCSCFPTIKPWHLPGEGAGRCGAFRPGNTR